MASCPLTPIPVYNPSYGPQPPLPKRINSMSIMKMVFPGGLVRGVGGGWAAPVGGRGI